MRLGFSFSGAVAPSEVTPLRLLVVLVMVEGDCAGGWRVAAEVNFAATASSAVILAMMSKRRYFVIGV